MPDTISVDELSARLERGEALDLVDVRDAEDHAEWTVPGARNVDAYEALREGRAGPIATLTPRSKPVVTICYAGRTSAVAARFLRERGHPAVSLEGGMIAWSTAWNLADVPTPGNVEIVQVRRTGKGCLSYVVACEGEAAIIDPSAKTHVYLDLLRERGWSLRHVLETHVHADHVSRAIALADSAGARLHVPRTDRIGYVAKPVDEGTVIRVGTAEIVAFRTPGHTEESTCYHLPDRAVFTGDTLFLGSIGRPDLAATPEGAAKRARALHASLRRVFELPGSTLVLPCHTSSPVPFDGVPLAAPLDEVKEQLPLLELDEEEFVRSLLADLPPPPSNHLAIVKANEKGDATGLPPDVEAGANRCAVR